MALPKNPGIYLVSVKENIEELFNLDEKVAKSTPSLLPLENSQSLLNFLTKEHESETYILNNDAGNFVGYLSIIDFPNENYLEVLNLGVDPDFQGNGYGRKMMSFAEELAKGKGLKKIRLVTNVKNLSAIGFYKGIGYKIITEAKNYYGDGENRYIFEKAII